LPEVSGLGPPLLYMLPNLRHMRHMWGPAQDIDLHQHEQNPMRLLQHRHPYQLEQGMPLLYAQMRRDGWEVTGEPYAILPHYRTMDARLATTQDRPPHADAADTRRPSHHRRLDNRSSPQWHAEADHTAIQANNTRAADSGPRALKHSTTGQPRYPLQPHRTGPHNTVGSDRQ
jgi:hypothetical protein